MCKMIIISLLLLLLLKTTSCKVDIKEVKVSLENVINFINYNIDQFGFDGIFGVILAQTQLIKILNLPISPDNLNDVRNLIIQCQNIIIKAKPFLPKYPPYMVTFQNKLINTKNWLETLPNNMTSGEITNLGIYQNWTPETILTDKKANYKGVKSDVCLGELLANKTCAISQLCRDMMLNVSRIDSGYLLTHRLLYIQIKRLQGCFIPGDMITTNEYSKLFCSYIYKEAKTSQYLDYPYHDIFLEQVVLCGMEGYSEFLNDKWLYEILKWQNTHGCYESIQRNIQKRTSQTVIYGCSDHSTGLGAAVLALYLKYFYMKKIKL